jgi:hypothetical protein
MTARNTLSDLKKQEIDINKVILERMAAAHILQEFTLQLPSHMGSSISNKMHLPSIEQGKQLQPISPGTTTSVERRTPLISLVNTGICLLYEILSNPYSSGSGPMQTSPHGIDPRRILLPRIPKRSLQRQDLYNHGLIKRSDKICDFIHDSMESQVIGTPIPRIRVK